MRARSTKKEDAGMSANRLNYRAWLGDEFDYMRVGDGQSAGSCPVQMSTGLTDKNGKEIFEGDVVRQRYSTQHSEESGFDYVVEYHADKIIEIGWEDDETRFTGFVLKGYNAPDEPYWSEISHRAETEIIGNIYEHGHLLDKSNGIS